MKSVTSGTPAVIVPTYSERESNARRVAAVGAGEYVLPKAENSRKKKIALAEFREKIECVLSTSTYLLKAQIQSQKLAAYDGLEKTVTIIEDFIGRLKRVT